MDHLNFLIWTRSSWNRGLCSRSAKMILDVYDSVTTTWKRQSFKIEFGQSDHFQECLGRRENWSGKRWQSAVNWFRKKVFFAKILMSEFWREINQTLHSNRDLNISNFQQNLWTNFYSAKPNHLLQTTPHFSPHRQNNQIRWRNRNRVRLRVIGRLASVTPSLHLIQHCWGK